MNAYTAHLKQTLIAALAATLLTGCFDVELEVPILTQVATVTGNLALYNAKATLHGDILEPARIDGNLGLGNEMIDELRLADFELQVTADAKAGPDDVDDLQFVESMVVYVRSVNPDSHLDEVAVAWYYRDESEGSTPTTLRFEVDTERNLMEYLDEGFELTTDSVSRVPMDDVSVEGLVTFSAR